MDYFLTLAGAIAAGAEQSSFAVVVTTTGPSGATDLELTLPTSAAARHHLIGVGEHTSAKR